MQTTIPDRLDPNGLAAALQARLAGPPADGSPPPAQAPAKVVWVDHGDEVLVHLDSLQVSLAGGTLLVALDLETDQTGRATLVAPFACGADDDPAGLVAVTETYPRGNAALASRWGEAMLTAVWAGLLGLAQDHALQGAGAPLGLSTAGGTLGLAAGARLEAT